MKRKSARLIWLIYTAVCITLLFTACTSSNSHTALNIKDNTSKHVKIVTTIFPPYDFAKNIAGSHADIIQLLPAGAESHSFEPTPQDIISIQECDIFIYAGGESDTWIEDIVDSIDTSQTQFISMLDCVSALEEETVEGMQEKLISEESDCIDEEPEYDEHVWTSLENAIHITEKITEVLCRVDDKNAAQYRKNEAAYTEKLRSLDQEYYETISECKQKTIVVADRFPFRYLADAYGLTYYAAFPGCSEDAEPSAATLVSLVDKVKDEHIPVVFHIEFSNEKVADIICESTGAKKLLLDSCHNRSKEEIESGVSYIDMMKQNLENLKEALQ